MACAAPLRPRSPDDSKLASLLASTSLAVVSQSVAETLELQPDAPSPRAKPLSRSSSAEQLLAVSSESDTARSDEEHGFVAQAAMKAGPSKLQRVTFASTSFHGDTSPTSPLPASEGLAVKFARAKLELDAELHGFAREAQALTEGVAQSADEEVLQALGRRLLALCRECRAQASSEFELSCRGVTYQLEQERRCAEGRIARSLVTRMLFSLTRCTRLLPDPDATEIGDDDAGGPSAFSFGTRRLSEERQLTLNGVAPVALFVSGSVGHAAHAAAAAFSVKSMPRLHDPVTPPAAADAAAASAACESPLSPDCPESRRMSLPMLRVVPPERDVSPPRRVTGRNSNPGERVEPAPAVRAAAQRARSALDPRSAAAALDRSPLPEGPPPGAVTPQPSAPPAGAAHSLATPQLAVSASAGVSGSPLPPPAPHSTPEGIAAIGNVLGAMVGKVVEWNAAAQREVVSIGTGMAGALRLNKPVAGGSPRKTNMMCRICEEMVAIGRMEEHSRACALADQADNSGASVEERLAALAETLAMRGEEDGFSDESAAVVPSAPPSGAAAVRLAARESRDALVRAALSVAEMPLDGSASAASDCASHLGEVRAVLSADVGRAPAGGNECVQTFGRRMEQLMVAHQQRLEEDAEAFAAAVAAGGVEGCPPTPSRDGSSPYGGAKPPNGMALDDYDILKPISRGAFGRVMLARKRTTGDLFALKVLRKRDLIRKNLMEAALAERDALARGGANPFVVRLFYTFTTSTNLYLVMEYAPGGDCYSLLRSLGCLEEPMVRTYAAEVVLALEYCHARGVVHRDLKPDNLLVSASGHLKLADFGLSLVGLADQANDELGSCGGSGGSSGSLVGLTGCPPSPLALPAAAGFAAARAASLGNGLDASMLGGGPGAAAHAATAAAAAASGLAPQLSGGLNATYSPPRSPAPRGAGGCVGTPDYLAPEILLGTGHGPEADWWALGVILYEFLTGVPPFNARTPQAIFDNILNRKLRWPSPPDGEPLSPAAVALIDALMTSDPAARLGHSGGAGEVKAHPFFEGLDWEQLARQKHEAAFVPVTESDTDTSYFAPRGRGRHGSAVGSWGGRSGSWGGRSGSWGDRDSRRRRSNVFGSMTSEGGTERRERRRGSDGGSAEYAAMMEGDDGDMAGCGFGLAGGPGGEGDAGLWNMQAANLFFANFSFKNLSQLATFNIDLVLRHHQAEKEQSKADKEAAAKQKAVMEAAASPAGAAAASPASDGSASSPQPMDLLPADSGGGFAHLSGSTVQTASPGADSVGSGTPPPATPEQPRA